MEEQLLPTKGNKFCSTTVVLSTCVVMCGSLAYGFAIGYSSPAQSGIMADLGLSIADYSAFGAILTLGGTIGALVSGTIADMVGRRITMWIMDICFILGWLSIIFATSAWWLDIGRFQMGIGAGVFLYVAPIYIAEISPQSIRGACTAVITFMAYFGISVMFLIGNILTWRPLAIVGIIPCVVQLLGIFFIPESPRWLATSGLYKEVEASLKYLRGKNVDISSEADEIKDNVESLQKLSGSRYLDMFNRKYAHSLIVGFGVVILLQSGGTDAIASFASSIFKKAGSSVSFATTTMGLIQLPFAPISKRTAPVSSNALCNDILPVQPSGVEDFAPGSPPLVGGATAGISPQWQFDEFLGMGDFNQNYGYMDGGSSKADNGKVGESDSSPILRDAEVEGDECFSEVPEACWAVPQIPSPPTASGLHWPMKTLQNPFDCAVFESDVDYSPLQNFQHEQSNGSGFKRRRAF